MKKILYAVRNLTILIFIVTASYLGFSQVMKSTVPALLKGDALSGPDTLGDDAQNAEYSKESTVAQNVGSKRNSTNNKIQKKSTENKHPDSLKNKDENRKGLGVKKTERSTSLSDDLPYLDDKSAELIQDPEIKDNDNIIPYDELISMKNVGLKDKLSIIAIMNKVKKSNMDKIYAIAKDGIAIEEIDEIRAILEEDLNKKDINKLMEIINKNIDLYAQGKEIEK